MDDTNDENIVSLPDHFRFWTCELCGGNVQASMQENKNEKPVAVTIPAGSLSKGKKVVFCIECSKNRQKDVETHIEKQMLGAINKSLGNLVGERPSFALSSVVGNNEIIRSYESELANSGGEKLSLVAWKTAYTGIEAALLLSSSGQDRPLALHMLGLSVADFDYSLRLISSYYKSEFGELKPTAKKRVSLAGIRLPMFRCKLIESRSYLELYQEPGALSLRLGNSEMLIDENDLEGIVELFEAIDLAVAIRDCELLQAFAEIPTQMSAARLKISDKILFRAKTASNVSIAVDVTSFAVIKILYSNCIHYFSAFDFIDVAKILKQSVEIIKEKNPSRRSAMIGRLRAKRYARLSSVTTYGPGSIMKDLGWLYEH